MSTQMCWFGEDGNVLSTLQQGMMGMDSRVHGIIILQGVWQ